MTVKISKSALNLREELADLRKPSGIAGEAMLRAETPQEQFNLIGAGRRNLAINGAMDIWQRGTSFSSLGSADTYSADRMHSVVYDTSFANASHGAIDRVSIYSTKLDGVNFSHALKISPSSSWKLAYFDQRVEDVTKFSDVDVTVSYYVRANTNVSLSVTPRVNQVFGSGGSSTVATYHTEADTHNLTTDWQRISYTIHCPSISGKTVGSGSYADFYIYQSTDLSALSSGWIQITGLQIEYGKVATPFEHRLHAEELALCQRFCNVIAPNVAYGHYGFVGWCESATRAKVQYTFPVVMRAAPTLTRSGSFYYDGATTNPTFSSQYGVALTPFNCRIEDNISNGTTGQGIFLINNNDADATITFDAEL